MILWFPFSMSDMWKPIPYRRSWLPDNYWHRKSSKKRAIERKRRGSK